MSINNLLLHVIKVLVCLVFLTPLIITNETVSPYVVGKAIYSNILIEIIFGLWLILIFYNKEHRPKSSLIYLLLIVYLLVMIITSLFGVDFARSFWSDYARMQGIFTFIHWIGLILVIISVCKTWQDYRNIIIVNACVSIIVCLGIILNYPGLVFVSTKISDDKAFYDYISTIGNTSFLAQYCVTIIFLVLHVAIKHYSMFGRILSFVNILSVIVIVLNIITLWYASSRAAYLSVLVFMLVFGATYLFASNIKAIKYIAYVSLSAVLFLVIFALFVLMSDFEFDIESDIVPNRINAPLQKLRQSFADKTILARSTALEVGIKSFYNNPLRGIGNENYIVAWGRYIDQHTQQTHDYPHNKLIGVLSANGIFGFIAYCTIWILLAITIISAFRQTQKYEQMSILVLGGAMLCFFINIMFLFDTLTGMMQFALLTSMFVYYEHKYNTFTKIKQKLAVPDKYVAYITRVDFSTVKFVASMFVVVTVALLIFMIPVKQYSAARYSAAISNSENIGISTQYLFYKKAVSSFGYADPIHLFMLSSLNKYVIHYYMESVNDPASLDLVNIILEDINENESQDFKFYMLVFHTYAYLSLFDDSYFDTTKYYYERIKDLAPTHPRLRSFNDFIFQIDRIISDK